MVKKVPAQPDADMLGFANDLKWDESQLVTADAFGVGTSIWKCATHTHGGVGFWIGHIKAGGGAELYAYLALLPGSLGTHSVLEGKKAWTDITWRRQGLGLALLKAAVAVAPVRSDSDGMTDPAFAKWIAAKGLRLRWWDAQTARFVDAGCVPEEDRFTYFDEGNRWVMVMDIDDRIEPADYPTLLRHILEGKEYGPMLSSPDVETHRAEWRDLFKGLIACPPRDRAIVDHFHTKWHVSHHFIRALVADDNLIMDMLWVWLPRYDGPSMLLYRGENIDRLEVGKIGSAWTDQEETARMFASGLNAEGKGGVILRTHAPMEAIIAAPSAHSANWLHENEFTLDTRKLGEIEKILRFDPRPR